ncbi:winged helix-turn-helix transcriptional regulator [Cryobacterium arcticum]|uniref:Transcriptional regulator n=1 Tax=Cryobacterium arcticum TaxID=670052 RepID=A0A317ZNT8_9MICO|nr:helix-turn-helix domain-containing protein [Cryobacterium arcticum]PXA68210.1 transcriptional regulator [Cryobacterium arcticum]
MTTESSDAPAAPATAKRSAGDVRCSIARTMQVLGDRWTILIVREGFRGSTRFTDFRRVLGIPTDILTSRLASLVEAGVLERRGYREPGARERFDYHLTAAGIALLPVLGALTQWGNDYRPSGHGPSRLYQHAATGEATTVAFVTADGRVVPPADIAIVPGPGENDPEVGPIRPIAVAQA